MKINIVLYNNAAVRRVKKRTYEYLNKKAELRFYKNIVWLKNAYIEFVNRMIIVNMYREDLETQCLVFDCLNDVLKNEEVSINCGDRSQYGKTGFENPFLIVNHIQKGVTM